MGHRLTLEEGDKVIQSVDDIDRERMEVKVIDRGVRLVQIRLVEEVPRRLEVAECFFDVVSKGCTFSERMILLVLDDVRTALSELVQLLKCGIKGALSLVSKNSLSAS